MSRVTRVAIYKGEAIVPGRLVPAGTAAGLDLKITPGKRAYGIRINDVASMAGLIQPNSRVDIMVVVNDSERRAGVAKLFMENKRVLAIGVVGADPDGPPINAVVASIEVSAEEAERLAIASAQGPLQLVLRGYGDPDSTSVAVMSSTNHDLLNRGSIHARIRPLRPTRMDSLAVRVYPNRPRVDSLPVHVYRNRPR